MKFLKISSILCVFALFLVFGCQKDNYKTPINQAGNVSERNESSQSEITAAREAFAETFARALQNEPALLSFVHLGIQKMDTSDYEMVYLAEKNKVIRDGLSFSSMLKSYATKEVLATYGDDFFDNIVEICPLLAISMPDLNEVPINSWEDGVIPDVAAVSAENSSQFKLYKNGGEISVELVADDEELAEHLDGPTLSIWDAEAYYLVNAEGMTHWGVSIYEYMPRGGGGPENGDCDHCNHFLDDAMIAWNEYNLGGGQYALLEHNQLMALYDACIEGCEGSGGGGGGNPPCDGCERDCELAPETLVRYRINGWSVFKNIDNQRWENRYVFHGDVVAATRDLNGDIAPYTLKYVSGALKKGDILENCGGWFSGTCTGKWQNVNYRIWADWDNEILGDPYMISWAEVDSGTKTTKVSFPLSASFKVNVPLVGSVTTSAGVTATFERVGDKIVLLGSAPVFYCDPILQSNNTGSIEFECN